MSSVRVLIVEDDKSSAFSLRRMLADEGFEVCAEARTGEVAVAMVVEHEPDIVLMDISIEGEIDGVEAVTAIREFSEVPIIYLTGSTDKKTIERAKRTSPFGYILKPFTKKELAITIQMAIYKGEVDARLRQSEVRLSTILANIPDAVIHVDHALRVVYMNPSAELFTQQILERAKSQSLETIVQLCDLYSGEVIEPLEEFLLQELGRRNGSRRVRMRAPTGMERIVEPWAARLPDAAAEKHGYVITLHDVTQQHLAESEARTMAAAFASVEDAVVITDCNLEGEGPNILFTNPAFEKITGYRRDEIRERPLSSVNRFDSDVLTNLKGAVQRGRPLQGESINTTRDGREYHNQWAVSPIREEGGTRKLVFVMRDVSRLRRLEENIRQSQKIEAVGRLAGGIAHDFNNLLSVINSYSDLQILKLSPEHPAMKYAQQIRTAGHKGADLVSQLMTFSRRDKPTPTSLDLRRVVHDLESMLRRVIRENIELEIRCDKDVTSVRADQGQVEQALINLCVNARDAMPNGGKLLLEVKQRFLDEEDVGATLRPGNYVVLAATDDGCGIDEETQKHIFDPFFTTKEIGKGTGLGLSTVYGIMKQLGGSAAVHSQPGEGARFELLFPAEDRLVASDTSQKTVEAAPKGSEDVLVVEDDETFLDCIAGLLSLHGYRVHTALNGEEALKQLDRLGESLDLLITDIVLPKASGREVANRLMEINRSAKVIFMTGYDDQLDNFYSFPSDSILLEKPFPLNTLLGKVREILDKDSNVKTR